MKSNEQDEYFVVMNREFLVGGNESYEKGR